jgi:2-polyprenyl-3-methyl-5-hydroxy-6-metoxy-1,4-benzoquinol methylase
LAIPEKCPLCNACADNQAVVTSHVYGSDEKCSRAFFHCNSCDVRYQFPSLTPEEEARFYAAEFEGFMASRAGVAGGWQKAEDHVVANESTRQRRMKYIAPHLTTGASILEVGCSSGFMLLPLSNSGYVCTGVEPSGVFSDFVKSKGLSIYDSLDDLKKSRPNELFDMILHFFVLEHIADPVDFLKIQLSLLKPGGKIIFEIPNAADPLYSVYDIPSFERFYWSVAHPWYFNEVSTQYLLKKLGLPYEIIREQRYDFSNHMVWARDGKPGGMGRFTETLGAEFDESYKQALIKTGNCDTLVGIVTKE